MNLELMTAEPLGHGGEGIVFRTLTSPYAVKLCKTNARDDDLAERLARLRWLPLEDIPICRPLELLAAPHVGYVMELLEDMVALRSVCEPTDGDLGPWYAQAGGLRRRLRLLARCAEILGLLHGRGIVYSDVSPGNVLISASPSHEEVWLVDADNLQIESSTVDRRLVTPFYTAPELLRGMTGNTVHSDMYSFAVVAYEALVANHPLLGDLVEEGPVEYQDDVQRGLLPWVGHRTDDRNRSTQAGLDPDLVLTKRLQSLFSQTFEEGLADPWRRPDAGSWANALRTAADLTIVCPSCNQSYYGFQDCCPWCRAALPPVLVVQVLEQFPPLGDNHRPVIDDLREYLLLQPDHQLTVTSRTAFRGDTDSTSAVVRMDWDGKDEVAVRNIGGKSFRRVPPQGGIGRQLLPGGRAVEQVHSAWTLHFGAERHPHRMLVIQPPQEPAR
ncbi:protein kinase domain-containing protein [Micromonospora aurantiaca (nom. illeg.)]|uniref:protein kinase domain-containing protein n=1 Tax=Micromonospora aurantiaca (nom. illeg.) TaxID=47850 RepID=UPI003F49F06B